jgi:hypothetical protein
LNAKIHALLCFLIGIPLLTSAVDWQMDSAPFSWADVGVNSANTPVVKPSLTCLPHFGKEFVTFRYTATAGAGPLTLSIYAVSGALVKAIALRPGANAIQWKIAPGSTAGGIYFARLHGTNIDKAVRFSLVK